VSKPAPCANPPCSPSLHPAITIATLPGRAPETEIIYVDISGVEAQAGIVAKEAMTFGSAPSRARRQVLDGDTIVSTVRTYLRAIAPIRNPEPNLIVSTGFAVIRPGPGLVPKFVGYLLTSSYFIEEVIARSVGVSYPAINASDLVRISVAVPSPTEQIAIATFLDRETAKIDALVAEQRRLIELLKEKRQAVISHAVTKGLNPHAPMKPSGIDWLGDVPKHWEVKKLHYILNEPPRNGTSPAVTVNGDIPTFSIAAVRDGVVNIDDHLKYVSIDLKDAEQHFVKRGDVLVLRGSGSKDLVGTAGLVKTDPPEHCIYPDILIRIRPTRDISCEFLVHVLNSNTIRPQLETSAQTAAGIWKVSGGALDAIHVPVPPVQEQLQIEEHLVAASTVIDALADEAVNAVALLQERRTALISAAVTGKIDVRNAVEAEVAV
jgi:type I restriction enzyme S subunit